MKITQHGKHFWKLTRFWFFNSYIVAEDNGLTLIDTNFSGSASGILRAAGELNQPVTRIALTHAHGDHAGSLDELSARLPDAEIVITQRTADFLQGNLALLPGEPQAVLRGSFTQ
jgi:glyoxylase-like metal-dependent hydrolase (beta-lactamase superfamily II)